MNVCKKCASEFQGNYCPNCGHAQKVERINSSYILAELGSILNFQKGILYTIKQLLIRPGDSIRIFLTEDRNRLVKPIMFILITSLVYTFFVEVFQFSDGYLAYDFSDTEASSLNLIFEWIASHYGYSNMIMAVFIAMWIKLLFSSYKYNFYEILILLCFVMGIGMLMFTVFGVFESLTHTDLLTYVGYLFFFYALWAIGQFFDQKKWINYVKALISYVLGMVTFVFASLGLGILLDFIL